jgi:hypothetical protein
MSHDQQKAEWEAYRAAAQRLYPEAKIAPMVAISEDADKNGGFLTVAIWVPREEMEKDLFQYRVLDTAPIPVEPQALLLDDDIPF